MTKVARYIEANRYRSLLISLIVLIFVPFFTHGPVQQVITTVCLSLLFIIAVGAVSASRRFYLVLIVVVCILILFEWLIFLIHEDELLRIIAYTFFLLFMGFIVVRIYRFILGNANVNFETIMAAISIYLLFGLIGALLAGIIDVIYPEAYTISSVDHGLVWNNFLYYSFITLTTLGYGDIIPVIEESKALAILLSVLGPFYMATVIGILIAKYRDEASGQAEAEG